MIIELSITDKVCFVTLLTQHTKTNESPKVRKSISSQCSVYRKYCGISGQRIDPETDTTIKNTGSYIYGRSLKPI